MQIEILPEWHLPASTEAEIAGLLGRCFSTDFGGRSYFQQRHHLRLVARQEGRVIGHMGLQYRAIRLGPTLTDVMGLADVATDPGHRGQGIAADLLQAAITEARLSPARFFLLFGTARLYPAAGFRKAPNILRFVEMRGARTGATEVQPALELMVLPLHDTPWDETLPVDLLGALF